MIRLENEAFESSIIDERYHIAVPVQITEYANGTRLCLVYSFCRVLAEEYEAAFPENGDPASPAWLHERLMKLMDPLGYENDPDVAPVHLEYRMGPEMVSSLAEGEIQPELLTVLTEEDRNGSPELELDAFEMDGTDPDDAMTVIRENGRIVCFAAVNDIIEADDTMGLDWIELNVECAPDCRRRGYAAACVRALTKYYLEKGKGVKYLCDEDNTASIRTAEKVGFPLYSRVIPFVYYRRDPEEDITEENENGI